MIKKQFTTEIEPGMLAIQNLPGNKLPIGEQIKMLRQGQNISRSKLARMANIANFTLDLIEHGQTAPRSDTLEKIFEALGYRLERLATPIKK